MQSWVRKHSRIAIIFSFFLLSFLSLYVVYFRNGNILTGDDYHFHQNRIEGLAMSLQNGTLLPKISYFFIGGYGYASSLFYPDFYLYFPALLRVMGLSLASSFIAFSVVINFATFLITYLSGRYMTLSKGKSYLFSLLYTLSIYRLQDFLNRQAIGELLAMSFFPLVLASLYCLKKGDNKKWLLLTLAMTGIGLAHVISVEIVSIFIGSYIILNPKIFFKKEPIIAIVKAAGLTVLFLAFYLVPVFEQMRHVTFQVTANPLTLISDESYSISEVFVNSFKNNLFHASSANIGIILLVGLIVYMIPLFKKMSPNRELIILSVLFMVMTTNLFPWQFFNQTPLNTIQFPWRFLSIVTLLLSFLIANDDIGFFKKFPDSKVFVIAVILLGVIIYEAETLGTEEQRILSHQKYDETNSYYIGAGHEYLPKEVDYSKIKKNKTRKIGYDPNEIDVTNIQLNVDSVRFDYDVKSAKKSTVTIPFIYYYGYQAKIINGNKTNIISPALNLKNGLVDVTLSGKGRVTVYYQTTLAQKLSLVLSLTTFLICLIWNIILYLDLNKREKGDSCFSLIIKK